MAYYYYLIQDYCKRVESYNHGIPCAYTLHNAASSPMAATRHQYKN